MVRESPGRSEVAPPKLCDLGVSLGLPRTTSRAVEGDRRRKPMLPKHEVANVPHLEPVGTGFPGAAAARPDGARTPAPRPSPESIVDNTDHSIDPTDEMAKKAHDYRLHRDENEPPEGMQPPPFAQRERYDINPVSMDVGQGVWDPDMVLASR